MQRSLTSTYYLSGLQIGLQLTQAHPLSLSLLLLLQLVNITVLILLQLSLNSYAHSYNIRSSIESDLELLLKQYLCLFCTVMCYVGYAPWAHCTCTNYLSITKLAIELAIGRTSRKVLNLYYTCHYHYLSIMYSLISPSLIN